MASNEQRQKLHDYLMKKYSGGYDASQAASDNLDAQGKADNALAASLMKSASQVGTLGGKQTDTSPVSDMANHLNDAMDTYRGRVDKREADREKLYSYLAEKEQKAADTETDDLRASAKLKQDEKKAEEEKKWKESRAAVEDAQKNREFQLRKDELAKKGEDKPVTADERKMGLFAEVTTKELPRLEELETKYRPGIRAAAADYLPGKLSNYAMTDEDRAYDAASRRILDPLIRATSGANAPQAEVDDKRRSYTILPGDDEATIKQKQKARREFIAGIVTGAGKAGAGKVLPTGDIPTPGVGGDGTAIAAPASKSLEEMTDDELEAYNAAQRSKKK